MTFQLPGKMSDHQVIPLGTEIRASKSGHRLLIDFLWDEGLKLIGRPATSHGYGFRGRAAMRFLASWRPGQESPDLLDPMYSGGGAPRHGAISALGSEIRRQFELAVDERPELHFVPCSFVRSLGGDFPGTARVADTPVGPIRVEYGSHDIHIESVDLLKPDVGVRRVLARYLLEEGVTLHVWTLGRDGVRRSQRPSKAEQLVVQSLVKDVLRERSLADYGGQRRLAAPYPLKEKYGVETVHDLVERLNAERARTGRPRLPSGSYPSSMVRLRSFLRIVDKELGIRA